jgi:3-oxoacyl-[acyl-carrier protein] reductase
MDAPPTTLAPTTPAPTAPALAPPPGARIAVVGGCGGIGRAVVSALHAAGCRTMVLDLPASIARHPPEPDVPAIALDATDEARVAAAFARIEEMAEALDGLVNLAGFAAPKAPLAETGLAAWEAVVAGNLTATFLCLRHGLPLLRRGRHAAVVNTASGLAVKPTPGYGPYSAAKAGVLSLTRLAAQENAPLVRCNAVAPGAVDTAFLSGGTGRGGEEGAAPVRLDREAYVRTVPMGRLAEPVDVVGPILFLLGPASAYVTGQTLHVNGGLWMG